MTYDVRFSLWQSPVTVITVGCHMVTDVDTKAIFVNNKEFIEVYFSLRPVTVGSQVKTCSELTS